MGKVLRSIWNFLKMVFKSIEEAKVQEAEYHIRQHHYLYRGE